MISQYQCYKTFLSFVTDPWENKQECLSLKPLLPLSDIMVHPITFKVDLPVSWIQNFFSCENKLVCLSLARLNILALTLMGESKSLDKRCFIRCLVYLKILELAVKACLGKNAPVYLQEWRIQVLLNWHLMFLSSPRKSVWKGWVGIVI